MAKHRQKKVVLLDKKSLNRLCHTKFHQGTPQENFSFIGRKGKQSGVVFIVRRIADCSKSMSCGVVLAFPGVIKGLKIELTFDPQNLP